MNPRILFIGSVSGYTSYQVVCKGLIKGLLANGIDITGLDATWDCGPDHTDPDFLDVPDERLTWIDKPQYLSLVQGKEIEEPTGKIAFVLNPTSEALHLKEKGGFKLVGMHVGDVDQIPTNWLSVMQQEDLVVVPSEWMKWVCQKSGVTTPIMTVNHGIDKAFRDRGVALDRPPFVLLHPCSAIFYPERKSTPAVLEAFTQITRERNDLLLRIIVGQKTKPIRKMLKAVDPQAMNFIQTFVQSGGRDPETVMQMYEGAHVLLAPSRAEGFGIMPLEARACGLPVIQTLCTGHEDHLDPSLDPRKWGIQTVPFGDMVDAWTGFGRAPEVRAEWIYGAIKSCLTNYDSLRAAAKNKSVYVRDVWSWNRVVAPLAQWINGYV